MSDKLEIVAIDGPSGVGKSTVAKRVAAATGFTYLDTGAMYRSLAYFLVEHSIPLDSSKEISHALAGFHLELLPVKEAGEDIGVKVNDSLITSAIRTPEISMAASKISALAVVRKELTKMQQAFGAGGQVVAEGRDIGTVVFPQAAYKFFLDANVEVRSKRRVLQLEQAGKEVDYTEVLSQIKERDKNDSEREIAPLKKAEDALYIDTSNLDIDAVVTKIEIVIARQRK